MFSHEFSPFRILKVCLFGIVLAGCAITKPSQNSFQASIQVREWDFKADKSGKFYEMEDECTPDLTKDQNAFVLIHGIYGDEDTFGKLQEKLTFDPDLARLGPSAVYLMEYWSSRYFPNFQSLSELGRTFKRRVEDLVDCKDPKTIIIIAHSQGGLIAKEAVLSWREKGDDRDILDRTKLILIGTPNSFSTFAAYNNLIVNTIFAPITHVTSIFTLPFFGKAYVYNRQAFDMADTLFFDAKKDWTGVNRSKFMLNHIAKWGKHFPEGVRDKPKTYAIVGVKGLFNDFALNDGIVHSSTLLFAGIPAQRVHNVPYRHFDDVASVDSDHHRTFAAIKKIVLGKLDEGLTTDNADKSGQQLSPFKDLPYSIVTFVMDQKLSTDPDENAEEPMEVKFQGIDLDGEKTFIEEVEDVKKRAKSDFLITFLGSIGKLVILPFQTLLNFAYPATHFEDYVQRVKSGDPESRWKIMRLPDIVLDGPHKGRIYLSRESRVKSWFFEMAKDTNGIVEYAITDKDSSDPNVGCVWEYPIHWESQTNFSFSNNVKKIKLQPNAVNYIKVELENDGIKLSRAGCA
ncbi:MAG: hypothetical protein NPIRA03_26830 [Nitrospirales bacterium]|nr:MAG: hypothetical protein NPIRA03_26830 [Nitrospirales bacterium]